MRTVLKVRRRLAGELVPFEADAIAWLDSLSLLDDGLANGDPVTAWTSRINPTTASAAQSGVGLIPTLVADVDSSGKPGVSFNGTSHYMVLGDAWKLLPTSSYTTYVVVQRSSTATMLVLAWRDAAASANITQFQTTNRTIFAVGGSASIQIITPAFNSGERKVLTLLNYASTTAGFDAYINGVLGAATAPNGTGTPTTAAPLLGARFNLSFTGIEAPLAGTVQSVLAYSTEHDATARAAVLAFLYDRYGVVP
jgi:hypothetical protein